MISREEAKWGKIIDYWYLDLFIAIFRVEILESTDCDSERQWKTVGDRRGGGTGRRRNDLETFTATLLRDEKETKKRFRWVADEASDSRHLDQTSWPSPWIFETREFLEPSLSEALTLYRAFITKEANESHLVSLIRRISSSVSSSEFLEF